MFCPTFSHAFATTPEEFMLSAEFTNIDSVDEAILELTDEADDVAPTSTFSNNFFPVCTAVIAVPS